MKRYFTISFFSFANEEENDRINRKNKIRGKVDKNLHVGIFERVNFLFTKGSKRQSDFLFLFYKFCEWINKFFVTVFPRKVGN